MAFIYFYIQKLAEALLFGIHTLRDLERGGVLMDIFWWKMDVTYDWGHINDGCFLP
jgi:hypothetical protein